MTPNQRYERDVAAITANYRNLLAYSGGRTDPSRLLVVISATYGSELHLPCSLPHLLNQIRALGRSVDLLIGCNNGFESPSLEYYLEQLSGCSVIHGFCTKFSPNKPAPVFDKAGKTLFIDTGTTGEDRCFIVHQSSAPDGKAGVAAGKIRMFGDLFGLISSSIMSGWLSPQNLLICDAESEFHRLAPWSSEGFGEAALAILIERLELDPELQLLGTRNRFVVFEAAADGIRHPSPDVPLPAIQLYLNLVHARTSGFMWLPGGGTVGRTETMTALLSVIAEHYPSAWIEDVLLSVLAQAAGFAVASEPRVACLNRCPSASESMLARAQMLRWISGKKDLETIFDRSQLAVFTLKDTTNVISAGLRMVLEELCQVRTTRDCVRVLINCLRILRALPEYLYLERTAHAAPSEDPDAPSVW